MNRSSPVGHFYFGFLVFSEKNPVCRDRTHVPTCQKVTRCRLKVGGTSTQVEALEHMRRDLKADFIGEEIQQRKKMGNRDFSSKHFASSFHVNCDFGLCLLRSASKAQVSGLCLDSFHRMEGDAKTEFHGLRNRNTTPSQEVATSQHTFRFPDFLGQEIAIS